MIKKYLNLILGFSLFLVLGTTTSISSQEPQVKEFQTTDKSLESTNEFESFIKDFVAHVNSKRVAYKDQKLYFYANTKTSTILSLAFFTALSLGLTTMPFFMNKSDKDYTGAVVTSTISGIVGVGFSVLLIDQLATKIKKTPYLTLSSFGISCSRKPAINWYDLDENMPIITTIIKDQYGNQTGTIRLMTLRSKSSIAFDIISETGDNGLLPVKLEELREIALCYKNHFTKNMQTN